MSNNNYCGDCEKFIPTDEYGGECPKCGYVSCESYGYCKHFIPNEQDRPIEKGDVER